LRGIQVAQALEALPVKKVAELLRMAAVIEREVVTQVVACAEGHAAMFVRVEPVARDDVKNAAEAVAELRRKAARDHIDRLDHVWREARREQLVRVVEERDA